MTRPPGVMDGGSGAGLRPHAALAGSKDCSSDVAEAKDKLDADAELVLGLSGMGTSPDGLTVAIEFTDGTGLMYGFAPGSSGENDLLLCIAGLSGSTSSSI